MNIVQITPGAGGMYCGNCFRDNALVRELRGEGHSVLMLPLYLPMTLDEPDQSAGTPVFFGGISVYLEQKSRLFQRAPNWLRNLLASPRLLKAASGRAAKTRASDLGELTLSMLRGEHGNQARELEEMLAWLSHRDHPDVVCLSNALLLGLARRIRSQLRTRVVCMLQGEDEFLDALTPPFREACWRELANRAREVDHFIGPSHYFADRMGSRLGLAASRVSVVHNGINLAGYPETPPATTAPGPPVLGFFARMCREKGLDRLVEAFLVARRRVPHLKLRIGGACGPGDQAFVAGCRSRLAAEGALDQVEFHPNLAREAKIEFLRSLTLFSVPASYSEAFGLYLIEALAAGVPVVQPRTSSFPELVTATGGGVLCDSTPEDLGRAIADLASDPGRGRELGSAGQRAVRENFSVQAMAQRTLAVLREAVSAG
jgi:glycosyltransferase involved in cell wall biosynthesis